VKTGQIVRYQTRTYLVLPTLIDLVLARPLVPAGMIAEELGITRRAAQDLRACQEISA
jgi:hypothetical protein